MSPQEQRPDRPAREDLQDVEGLETWLLDMEEPDWSQLPRQERGALARVALWCLVGLGILAAWLHLTRPAAPGLELSAMVSAGADDWERLSRPSPRYEELLTRGWAASISEEANFSGDAQALGAPRQGSWLYEHPEPGQTWRQFQAQAHNRRTEARHTLYVAALGPMRPQSAQKLQVIAEYLDAYYDTRTLLLPPIPIPLRAWDPERGQYDARVLLECLRMNVPDDALGLLTITEADLFIPSTHHVFGLGSFQHRVSVVSLHHFGDDDRLTGDRGTVLRRVLTASSHELGHVFNMRHCTAFRCLMNGTNSLHEADEHPLHLCPECQRKAQHVMGFHRQDRYARLLDFYERYGFLEEVAFTERRLDPPVVEFIPDP
jgi:archaemetzincin